MIYAFNSYELDTRLHELRRAGEVVSLEPLAFKVLTYLVQHRDHAVSKDELIEHLWPGQFMKDWVLVQSVVKARRAVGDNGHEQWCIKTITGYGYRCVAAVEECEAVADEPQAQAPIPIQPAVHKRILTHAVALRQEKAELRLHELPLAGRIHDVAKLQRLLGHIDNGQEQVVILVLHLGVAPTPRAKRETHLVNALSHALQSCFTERVS